MTTKETQDDEGMQVGERSRLHDVEVALASLDAKAGEKSSRPWMHDSVFSAQLGRTIPSLAEKAELARIVRYYATESMLVFDPSTGRYDATSTPRISVHD
jgi:hypothetical protein